MNKDVSRRIAFYTRKVAEYGSVHPAQVRPRSYKYRSGRLTLYKKLMHDVIATNMG